MVEKIFLCICLSFFNLNFVGVNVVPVDMSVQHVCAWCLQRPKGIISPRTRITDGCKLPRGCWDPNPNPVEEQSVVLDAGHLSKLRAASDIETRIIVVTIWVQHVGTGLRTPLHICSKCAVCFPDKWSRGCVGLCSLLMDPLPSSWTACLGLSGRGCA